MRNDFYNIFSTTDELNDVIAQKDAEIAALHAKVRTVAENYGATYYLSSSIVQSALDDMGILPAPVLKTFIVSATIQASVQVEATDEDAAFAIARDMLPTPITVTENDVLFVDVHEV